jgi:hypothetical protein
MLMSKTKFKYPMFVDILKTLESKKLPRGTYIFNCLTSCMDWLFCFENNGTMVLDNCGGSSQLLFRANPVARGR